MVWYVQEPLGGKLRGVKDKLVIGVMAEGSQVDLSASRCIFIVLEVLFYLTIRWVKRYLVDLAGMFFGEFAICLSSIGYIKRCT